MAVSQEPKTEVDGRQGWHASEASAVAAELGVEPERGLSVEEARRRIQSHGPNRLTGTKKESGFQAFLRQYRDFMQIICWRRRRSILSSLEMWGPRSSWPG